MPRPNNQVISSLKKSMDHQFSGINMEEYVAH